MNNGNKTDEVTDSVSVQVGFLVLIFHFPIPCASSPLIKDPE